MAELEELDEDSDEALKRRSVQSVIVGTALLDALAIATGPLPLRELSRRAGMPPSKARRYLISFLECGLVEQHPATGYYDLGPMTLRLGFAALSRMDPVRISVERASELSRELDRTTMVAVWSDRGPIIIAWFDSSEILACNLRVGSVLPLTNSASGKLFLAYLPRETTRPLVEKAVGQLRERGGVSLAQARRDIDTLVQQVRAAGVGTTAESLLPGLSAVAAPVLVFHSRMMRSLPPEAMNLSCGSYATAYTPPSGCSKRWSSIPVRTSHTFTFPSQLALAIRWLSGLKQKSASISVCPMIFRKTLPASSSK